MNLKLVCSQQIGLSAFHTAVRQLEVNQVHLCSAVCLLPNRVSIVSRASCGPLQDPTQTDAMSETLQCIPQAYAMLILF